MTAAGTPVPAQQLRAGRRSLPAPARLLRLELRRSTMLPAVPLLAALLAFTEMRNDFGQLPLWVLRSADTQYLIVPIGAIVAAVAAWSAGRDGRHHVTDLMVTTARPRWINQLVRWAAVTAWATLFYAACVALVFVVTARQASWRGPIWWLPGVGVAAIVAFSAVGYAFGALIAGRFVAPLVAIGAALAPQVGVIASHQHHPWGLVSPAKDATVPGTAIFFPFHAGLSIVQIVFLVGVALTALGVLALPAAAGGPWLRRAGAMVVLLGLSAAATGVALTDAARQEAAGVVVPALHDAGSDKLITYTPVCDNVAAVPVCLHPAYRAMLPAFVAALDPMTSQVAGLAGAPVRVQLGRAIPQEISDGFRIANPTISGSPPVLYLSVYSVLLVQTNTNFNNLLRLEVANTVIAAVIDGSSRDSPAQQAITEALLINAEVPGSGPAVPG